MHPAQNDVLDFVLSQKVPRLLAVVRDRIGVRDFDRSVLTRPGRLDLALHLAVAAHVRVVDRQHAFALRVGPVPGGAPALGRRQRPRRFGERCILRALPLRRILVEIRAGTRRVNDERALRSGRLEHFVHRPR